VPKGPCAYSTLLSGLEGAADADEKRKRESTGQCLCLHQTCTTLPAVELPGRRTESTHVLSGSADSSPVFWQEMTAFILLQEPVFQQFIHLGSDVDPIVPVQRVVQRMVSILRHPLRLRAHQHFR
jgi:hypothetical protein